MRDGVVQPARFSFETIARNYQVRSERRIFRRHKALRGIFVVVALFLFLFSFTPPSSPLEGAPDAKVKPTRRVLILNEAGTSYPAINFINQGISGALTDAPYRLEFYREYMDTFLFPQPAEQEEIRNSILRKYQNHRPDVIITIGPSPLRFMLETHREHFSGVPVIYALPLRIVGDPITEPDFTGVQWGMGPAKTLKAALQLRPRTKHVIVVAGNSDFDQQLETLIRQELRPSEKRLDISYLTELATPELLERLMHLPPDTVILTGSFGKDAAGRTFISSEIAPLLVSAANAPIFSLAETSLNHGEVGGYVSNFTEQGSIAGGMALRILNGEKPKEIPVASGAITYMFDWRALKRWGMNVRNLPPGSVILNRQASMWEAYRWYIVGGVSLMLVQTLLIFALIWHRRRRAAAEQELAVTFERLRLAVESSSSVIWDWDVLNGRVQWFGDLEAVVGIKAETYSSDVAGFRRHVHPDDQRVVTDAISHSRRTRQPYLCEFRMISESGKIRWVNARGEFHYDSVGEALRMLGMAVDITERKLMEHRLRESQDRLAAIVGSALDAIIAINEQRRIVLFNKAAEKVFGWRQEEAIGSLLDEFMPERFRVQHTKHILHFAEASGAFQPSGPMWGLRRNGEEFPIETSISRVESDGQTLYTVILRDVTERVRAEAAIRESEERFRDVANTAPVMIWITAADRMCTYCNQRWLEFTGRPLEAELGVGWTECIHAEDLENCLQAYNRAYELRAPFRMHYRARRHDGEYRWVLDTGVPRFERDGSLAGYIGSVIDVTDQKLADEALADVGRRLIQAHEEERTWVARELHDDINQRLALASIELDQMLGKVSVPEVHDQMGRLRQHLTELSSDVQALSHRLHSSKLEYLGLVAASNSFCRELAEQQKVDIDFRHAGMLRVVPKEISLCLFRVLQEALLNAVKHSGARSFSVEIYGTSQDVLLTVSDQGLGFDQQNAINKRGLGLVSMRERVQLLSGEFLIKSQPGGGTSITARVPMRIEARLARAAG